VRESLPPALNEHSARARGDDPASARMVQATRPGDDHSRDSAKDVTEASGVSSTEASGEWNGGSGSGSAAPAS